MKKEIHLICNAHIDPIWQWDWTEGVSAVLSTFSSAVRLAEKHNYIFCHNEVTVYKYVEEYAPDLFEKIKALVNSGKWHIMGGWYLQPDANMPSGESFVRQIREGQRYFKEKFGVCPTTAINFDPFGHTVGLVQIIKKCGQDSYIFMRPYQSEMTLPSEQFIWRGLDGSEIKGTRSGPYNSPLGSSSAVIKQRADEQTFPVCAVLWGVGNHGGGPSDKDLSDIENDLLSCTDVKYLHSTPENFFAKIAPKDVVDTSLHISMPGCYTSMYRVKKRHAMLENEIFMAEKIASAAYLRGLMKYPEEQLRSATHDLLNAEFHDVLPGTSIQCGEEAGLRFLDHGLLDAERVKVKAYFALASLEKPAKDGEYPIVIFNPHPYPLQENIECEFMLADQNWSTERFSHITLKNEKGENIAHQLIKEDSNLNLDWRKRIIFKADLKPMALTRYSVYVDYKQKTQEATESNFVFDNGHKYVEIDRERGTLISYRIDGTEYICDGFGLVSFKDNADPWAMGAHQLERLGTNETPFNIAKDPSGVFNGMKSVQVVEDGEIYLGIEAFFEQDATRARILYKIYKNCDYIDIDVTMFMGDINRIFKLKLPTPLKGDVIGQTAFGTVKLFDDGRENVAHRFVAIDGGKECLALLNNGVYGSHYENGAIYMSLLRGVTYCAHPIADRPLLDEGRYTDKVDQGEHKFSFRLCVSEKDHLERRATEFVQKPFALNIFPIPSEAKQIPFDIALGDDSVSTVTVKKADGRNAVIFRLLNNSADRKDSYIKVNGAHLPLTFGKYEVKTVIYEDEILKESSELLI